jgi:S-ribosylhomocysteine lyase LuxS involved in autoinducer biosynthesis
MQEKFDQEVEDYNDESEEERQARIDSEVVLDELSREFVDKLLDKMLVLVDEISGHPLHPYQTPFARRVMESVIIGDGDTISALFSRQSGKSETVANVVAACMILLPRLAQMYPDLLGKFSEGLWVGAFAPVDEQADTLYGRIVSRLTSDRALEFMRDPEIDEEVIGRGKELRLKASGSLVRKTTCHPRAKIEGRTYHLILIDECQDAEEKVVNKSISPMGASTNATMVMTGTPTYTKGVFFKTIQLNKRQATKRGSRTNHFEADYKLVGKYNANYKKFVAKEILRIGQDSDEFKLSYRLIWLLDRGMFVTADKMDELGDKSMQVQHAWMKSPVIVGIDPARKVDSTIVTVVWIGWDYPDQFGRFEHRILNWLDLTGVEWEEQYFRITEFLSNYHVLSVGVDQGGVGDTVISRLRVLMPGVEVVGVPSDRGAQSKRWRYLMDLMRDGKIGWPAHAKTRSLRVWRKFRQQMEDAELRFEGPNVIVEAPNEVGAHDDFVDSLAIACSLSEEFAIPEVEQSPNFLYAA